MRFSVLGSGSKGNCVYIEHKKTAILIDNGFSGKQVQARLQAVGVDFSLLTGICVTHEHNDHVGGVGVLSRRCKVPVYANGGTFKGAEKKLGKLYQQNEFATGDTIEIQDLEVKSFPVSHDTLDPVGFVISNGTSHIGYCTDTGKVTKLMELRLGGCQALILEFNHNLQMLKEGPYPLYLQQRVRSAHGHLCNEDGAALLGSLMHSNLQVAVLAHLSETNNRPEFAKAAAMSRIHEIEHKKLVLAEQHRPTRFFNLD